MLDNLPNIQNFLSFLTRNVVALLLVLLTASVAGNVYLARYVVRLVDEFSTFKSETIKYERETKDKLEIILIEQIKRNQQDENTPIKH